MNYLENIFAYFIWLHWIWANYSGKMKIMYVYAAEELTWTWVCTIYFFSWRCEKCQFQWIEKNTLFWLMALKNICINHNVILNQSISLIFFLFSLCMKFISHVTKLLFSFCFICSECVSLFLDQACF